ncbi:MAG: FAD-binding protein, partial [Burkholderiales bacterium]|nr:FAD-binding protein [Burkholderiales bacterium]
IKGGWEPGQRALLAPPPPVKPGLHWRGRGADVMVRTLCAKLESRAGRLLRGVRARELMMNGSRCCGVAGTQGNEALRFEAGAVVLADGGFQADAELLRRYVTKEPDRLLQRNAGSGGGDGLRMALAAGARIRGTECFYGHVHSRDALANPLLWPYPTVDAPIAFGVALDARGERFADEGLGAVYMANAIARLPDPLEAVAVCDAAAWVGPVKRVARPSNPLVERAGGTVHKSYTMEGLAALAGLPEDALVKTLLEYNRAIDENRSAQLPVPRSASPVKPMAVRIPPFYALPVCAGITYTMGGVAIDERCRVRHADGHPIEGLYAAGSTTGGHEGGPAAGYTGGLGKAMSFGFHAGNCIVEASRAAGFRSAA